MAKFRYSMQSILNIKLKLETQAKQEFSAARAMLDEEERKLEALYERKDGYERAARKLLEGILDLRRIEENKAAVRCMEDFILLQKQNVAAAEQNLEAARQRLTEVMMERKTHERLKEKAFEEFLVEIKKEESKEVDQLTSYTYGQRRSEESRQHVPA